MGCVVFPGADPGDARRRHRRPGLSDRGLQRARRRRRLHVRLPARLAARRAARDLLRPGPMPAAPSRSRGCSARRKIPTWPELQLLPRRTAARTARCARTRRSTTSTGRRRGAPQPRHADGARHRPPRAARGDGRRRRRRRERIDAFKRLAVDGGGAGRRRPARLRHAARRHAMAARRCSTPPGTGFWIGRPIEQPGSRPLRFEFGAGRRRAARRMAGRPHHQVPRASIIPTTPPTLKARAGARSCCTLYDAARTVGRELLIEIIAGKHGPLGDDTVARALDRALRARHQARLVEARAAGRARRPGRRSTRVDRAPTTRGAAASCCSASRRRRTSSSAASRAAPARRSVKGFAVGRTIFADAGASLARRRDRRRGGDRRHGGALRALWSARWQRGDGRRGRAGAEHGSSGGAEHDDDHPPDHGAGAGPLPRARR